VRDRLRDNLGKLHSLELINKKSYKKVNQFIYEQTIQDFYFFVAKYMNKNKQIKNKYK